MVGWRNGFMGRVNVQVELANNIDMMLADLKMVPPEKVHRLTLTGWVDTGATRRVLPQGVVDQLGLRPSGRMRVRCADERSTEREVVENVWLQLQGRHGVFTAVVEPDPTDPLIGAIVMEDLDLLIDCTHQTVVPRDPNIIISEIE